MGFMSINELLQSFDIGCQIVVQDLYFKGLQEYFSYQFLNILYDIGR